MHFEAMKTLCTIIKISHHGQFECHVNTCPPKSLGLSVVLSAMSGDCCFVFSGTCNVAVNLSTREERASVLCPIHLLGMSRLLPRLSLHQPRSSI